LRAAVINESRGVVLAHRAEVADTFLRRLRGLMFRRRLEFGEGMILRPSRPGRRTCAIHTFFMRFPIDVLFLRDGEVVDAVENLRPWRVYVPREAAEEIVELPAGTIERSGTEVGDHVRVVAGDLEAELAVKILSRKQVTRRLAEVVMKAIAKSGLSGEVYYNKETGCIHVSGEDKYIVVDTIKDVFGDAVEVIEGRSKLLSDDHSLVVMVRDAERVAKIVRKFSPEREESLVYRQEPKAVRWGMRREEGAEGADEKGGEAEKGGGREEPDRAQGG